MPLTPQLYSANNRSRQRHKVPGVPKLPAHLVARLRLQARITAWMVADGDITPQQGAALGQLQAMAAYSEWRSAS